MKVNGTDESWEVTTLGKNLVAVTHDSWKDGKPFLTIGDVIFPLDKAEEIARMILLEAERKKYDNRAGRMEDN